MPQITTAFAPDSSPNMRWALDTASDRVPVTSRTPATKAKMAQTGQRIKASRTYTSSWRRRWPKAWCPRCSVASSCSQQGSLRTSCGHRVAVAIDPTPTFSLPAAKPDACLHRSARMLRPPGMLLLLAIVMWRIHTYNRGWKYIVTLLVMGPYARLTTVILDQQHSALR